MKNYLFLALALFVTPPSFADTFIARYDLVDSMDQFEASRTISLMRSGHGYAHMLRSDSGLECRITIGLKDDYDVLPKAKELSFNYKERYNKFNYKSEFYRNSDVYGYIVSTMHLEPAAGASEKLIEVHPSYVFDSPHVIKCWSQNEFDYEDVRIILSGFFLVKREWPSLREIVESAVDYVSDLKQ